MASPHNLSAEQGRLNRHVAKNMATATSRPSPSLDEPFHITLEGLPATPSTPVGLHVGGKQVYHSGQANGDVKTSVSIPVADLGAATLDVRLVIEAMGFDHTFHINRGDGHYLKLVGTDQGLQKKQQNKPW
jgi:hypothetical protein